MDKHRFFLIFQREYYSIVAKKSFLVSTILVPLLIIAIGVGGGLLMALSSSDLERVAVIDQTPEARFASALESTDEYEFVTEADMTLANMREKYSEADGALYAIVVIPADVDSTQRISVFSERTVKPALVRQIEKGLDPALSQARIDSYGIPELKRMMDDCNVEVDVQTYTWGENDDEADMSSSDIAAIVGVGLSFLTYMFVLMYGAMIMSSVVEDKTNRIVEVIVSSCRPIELMMGKIVGIAAVGLTQIAIWGVLIGAGFFALSLSGLLPDASATASMTAMGATGAPAVTTDADELSQLFGAIMNVNWLKLITVFIFYFIGGYLLYAALFAAFGSAVDQQSDASQFMTPIMLIIIFSFMVSQTCIENPDTTLAVVCSYIPFTSPIVMMVRLPYDTPVWEIGLSILTLYATALLMTWLAARIYRAGILRYGKATYRQLLRYLKG